MEKLQANTVDANIKCYDNYYTKPAMWFKFRYDTQVKKKTVLHMLNTVGKKLSNQRVLEIGFGSGSVLFAFKKNCAIHGIELSASAVENAKKAARKYGYRDYKFSESKDNTIPYQNNDFDIIIASHVLEHIEDENAFIAEISRCLKSDGVGVILVPINERYVDPNHVKKYTLHNLTELIEYHGLERCMWLENELLYYAVERFYFNGYNIKWKFFGPAIALIFNVFTSQFPFWLYRVFDKLLVSFGLLPRQMCFVIRKKNY